MGVFTNEQLTESLIKAADIFGKDTKIITKILYEDNTNGTYDAGTVGAFVEWMDCEYDVFSNELFYLTKEPIADILVEEILYDSEQDVIIMKCLEFSDQGYIA